MGKADVELAGLFGISLIVTGSFRHLSRSVGAKRSVLSVVVTVSWRDEFENSSSCAELRYRAIIEWE